MDEKKEIKSLNKKLFIALIIICAILGTIFAIRTIAATVSVDVSYNTGEINISISNSGLDAKYYWDLTDLKNNWYIVCCAHHQPLGSNHADADGKTGDFTFTITGLGDTTLDSEVESEWSVVENTTGDPESFDQDTYQVIWWMYFEEGTYIANPAEAYLLSVASTLGTGYVSSFQQAWWNTSIGSTGATGGSSSLWSAASNFQSYISAVIEANDTGQDGGAQAYYNANSSKYKEYTINGVTVTAPDLETYYNPVIRYYLEEDEIVTNPSASGYDEDEFARADVDQDGDVDESDRVGVDFEEETNSYVVGPFSLDYYEDKSVVTESEADLEALLAYSQNLQSWLNGGASGFTVQIDGFMAKIRTYSRLSTEAQEQLEADLIDFESQTETVFANMGVYTEFSSMFTVLNTFKELLGDFDISVTNGELYSALADIKSEFTGISSDLLVYLDEYIANLEIQIEEFETDANAEEDENGDLTRVVYDESFSYISGATLTTNLGSATLDETTGWGVSSDGSFRWTFRWVDGERDSDDTYIYPHDDEVFYIQIEYNGEALLTSIDGLDFEFTYMNAGGSFKRYTGTKVTDDWESSVEVVTYYYNWTDYGTDENGNRYISGSGSSSSTSYPSGHDSISITSIDYKYKMEKTNSNSENDAQMLGIVINGIRWYDTKEVTVAFDWEDEITTKLRIEKTVVDDDGNKVETSGDSYSFDVYVDYTGSLTSVSAWKNLSKSELKDYHFQTVTIKVTNGYGVKSTSEIVWDWDEDAENYITPTYYVVERSKSTVKDVDGVPTAGYCEDDETILIEVENTLEAHKGTLEVEKEIKNDPDNILEDTEFSFTITITGDFIYNGVKYTTSNPLTKNFTIKGEGTKTLKQILGGDGYVYWYGDAPTYEVVENVPDGAFYENTHSYNTKGTFKCSCDSCGNDSNVIDNIKFVNEPGTYAQLVVDKKLVSGTDPEPGEEFVIRVTLTGGNGGTFYYGDDFNNLEEITGTKTIEITLKYSNDWEWASEKIWWTTSKAPTYTIEEISMADHYEYVSITNGQKTTTNDVFTGTLTAGDTEYVTVTNGTSPVPGTLKLKKITNVENDTTEFTFNVTIKGYFEGTISGTHYDYGYHEVENVEVKVTANAEAIVVADIEWYEDDGTPTYTVEEVNIPSDYEFVSISNGTSTVTNIQSINGNFVNNDSVLVTCINNYIDTIPATIQINKEVLGVDSIPDDLEVTVELKISANNNSTFQYGGSSYDSSSSAVNYSTYVFSDDSDANESAIVLNKANNWSWTSSSIWWDTNSSTAPYYEVTEVSTNLDYCEFEYIVTSNSTVTTSSTGLIQLKQGSINAIEIVNSIETPVYGQIEVKKVSKNDNGSIVSGEKFNFTLEVTGTFTYDGTQYTNETLTLSVEDVEADGDSWLSGLFKWYESDGTPTYQIRENLTDEQISAGITFEGMYEDGANTNTSNVQDWLSGDLKGSSDSSNVSTVTVTGQNGSETHKGRIEYIKVLLDSDGNEITDTSATYDITIRVWVEDSDGNVTNEWIENKTISVGTTYRTEYFEWSGDIAPYYEVTEASGDYTSSISNGSGQLVCELCDKFGGSQAPIHVTITNTLTNPHEGYLQVTKKVTSDDKVSANDSADIEDTTFTIDVVITSESTFWYKDQDTGEIKELSYLKLTIYLKDGQTWGYDGTKWRSGICSLVWRCCTNILGI